MHSIPLNVMTAPWPFAMWGIDMIGMIEPKTSNGHHFILVVIDYFTKWVEAASYANVTKQVVVRSSSSITLSVGMVSPKESLQIMIQISTTL